MPATPEHKGDIAVLVRQLDALGKPRWSEKVNVADVFHDDDLGLAEKRDAIAARIKATRWYRSQDEFSPLHEAVLGLSDAEDEDEFNGWCDEIYDLADWDRVWIGTF